jgi:hypothetical protein
VGRAADDPVPRAGAGGAAAGDPADALAVPQQIFEVDALTCPSYHGVMRIVAFITQPSVIDQILTHRRPRG